MPFSTVRYDQETITLMQKCLDRCCLLIGMERPVDDALRLKLAVAIIEGRKHHGITGCEELMDFALRMIPAYREGTGRRSSPA